MKNSNLNSYFRWFLGASRKRQSEDGYVLVVVMGVILAMSGLFITTGLTTKVDKASGKANEESSTGFYAAEAGLNVRAQMIRQKFEGFNRPVGQSPSVVANTNTPRWRACAANPPTGSTQGTNDMRCLNDQDLNLGLQAINNQENGSLPQKLRTIPVTTFVDEPVTNNPANVTIPPGQSFAGLQAQEYRYDVTSVAYTTNNLANEVPRPSSILQMSFKSRLVPLFQFAAFYENDLDFSSPAEMNLNGPIHSNNNLYLNAASPIRVNGQLTSALRMYRGEKSAGNCNTPFSVTDPVNFRDIPCNGQRSEITTNGTGGTTSAAPWNGQIRPGIGRLTVPSNSLLDAKLDTTNDGIDDFQYWNKADLRIALKLDANERPTSIEVVNPDKSINTAATNILNSSTCLPQSTTVSGAVNTTTIDVSSNVTSWLKAGDAILIGTDSNENVVSSITNNSSGNAGRRIILSRPLRTTSSSTEPTTPSGEVRKAVVWSSRTFYNYREKQGSSYTNQWQQGRLIRMLNVDVQGLLSCAGKLVGSNTMMGGKLLSDDTDGGLVWHFTVLHNTTPSNSDVDVTATPPGSPNSYGVRLYNGARLASTSTTDPEIKGLTIATDQAVYVQGDYNCSVASDIPTDFKAPNTNIRTTDETNDNDPGCGRSSVVKKWKPAAILGDSLNVLSNAWFLDDRKNCNWSSATTLDPSTCPIPIQGYTGGSPNNEIGTTRRAQYASDHPLVARYGVGNGQAANTVINAAFLSGVDITGGVNGSSGHGGATAGGLNNYPRLHEHWGTASATLTYRGSMVSLGRARRVNGPFCGPSWNTASCNIYTPPIRNWSYDLMFNKAENLPPLTPRFVFLQQERFARDFEQQSSLPIPRFFASIFIWFKGLR
jgi:hypothetical protein